MIASKRIFILIEEKTLNFLHAILSEFMKNSEITLGYEDANSPASKYRS